MAVAGELDSAHTKAIEELTKKFQASEAAALPTLEDSKQLAEEKQDLLQQRAAALKKFEAFQQLEAEKLLCM